MSATINTNNLKFVIFGSGHDYTLLDSGEGEKQIFSHPFVPLNSVNYAGQYYFQVPDEDGNFFDAVKDDMAHCTFTPALNTAFTTEGETEVSVHYRREYIHDEETILVEKTVKQTITVVDHGTVASSLANMDIYTDGYAFIRPDAYDVVQVMDYALGSGNYTKVSSIPWRATALGHSIHPFLQSAVLTDISELEFADTSNCTRFKDLFHGAGNLTDLSAIKDWNTSNVTEMVSVLWYTGVTDLTAFENWDVSNVTGMGAIFGENSNLASLHGLEHWNISKVTTLNNAFWSCSNLTDISALENWDTSSLTNLDSAFRGCTKLSSLHGLENWDVSNVTDMQRFCEGCAKIPSLEPLANWSPKPTNLYAAFTGCSSIESLDGLENFDLSDCTSFYCAFRVCNKLIDISAIASWDVSNVTDFRQMFEWSHWINDVSAINGWTFGAADLGGMFGYASAFLNVDDIILDLSNCTNITNMFGTRKFGKIDETGEDAYEESDYYWTYDGESYSRLVYNLTPYTKDASNAENWTVNGTNLGAFDNWWSNRPSWN